MIGNAGDTYDDKDDDGKKKKILVPYSTKKKKKINRERLENAELWSYDSR